MGGGSAGSIAALLLRLIDSAKSFVRAEIALAKVTAFDWLDQAKIALVFLVVALVLVLAAITILLAALGLALAPWLGAAGGLAVAALIGLASAAILAVSAVRQLQRVGE